MFKAISIFLTYFGRPVRKTNWNEGHAANLRSFLQSPTGKQLLAEMQAQEAMVNQNAVSQKNRVESACGFALGFRSSLAWLISLSGERPPQADATNDQADQGDGWLVESLSP